jgi:cation diffusion facilitator CzcD-associated flavoprotein CzcO
MSSQDVDLDAVRARYQAERDKRLRSILADKASVPLQALPELADDPGADAANSRPAVHDAVDVVVVGGGIGGLAAAARLREAGIERVRVIDDGADFGGVWYWNSYPGAQCDVESYIYLPMLEEVGYIPGEKYAHQPEIFYFLRKLAEKYGLYEFGLLQTRVTGARWDSEEHVWVVATNRGDEVRASLLVLAPGDFSQAKLPGIPGIQDFQGKMFHTSRWDYDYTGGNSDGGLTKLADVRVALIGTGATAVQVAPHLGKYAKELLVFQRTPTTIFARDNQPTDPKWAASLKPGWQRERIRNFAAVVSGRPAEVDLVADNWTKEFASLSGAGSGNLGRESADGPTPEEQELADYHVMQRVRDRIDQIVKDKDVAESLKPYFRLHCKRPTFHDEYLAAFNRPNVTLVDTDGAGVSQFTQAGVVAAGVEYPVDCIVFATGFDTLTPYAEKLGFDVVGAEGVTLRDKWHNNLSSLHGLQTHGFPNCFMLGYTQTALSVNFSQTLQEQVDHLVFIARHFFDIGASEIEVKEESEQAWQEQMQKVASYNEEFWLACPPTRFSNANVADDRPNRYQLVYSGSASEFFDILQNWRDAGTFEGVEFR